MTYEKAKKLSTSKKKPIGYYAFTLSHWPEGRCIFFTGLHVVTEFEPTYRPKDPTTTYRTINHRIPTADQISTDWQICRRGVHESIYFGK